MSRCPRPIAYGAQLDQRLRHRDRHRHRAAAPINALFIQTLRIPSIIVSVATLNIFYGLLIFATGGKYIYSLPDWFATGIFWFEFDWRKDSSYGVNLQILMLGLGFLVTWLLLNRTNIGRQIYAMGGNPDAAQRLGFHVFRLNLLVYCYMGVMAGVASLVQAQLAQSVAPTVLVGKELDVAGRRRARRRQPDGRRRHGVRHRARARRCSPCMQNGLILLGVSSYWSPVVRRASSSSSRCRAPPGRSGERRARRCGMSESALFLAARIGRLPGGGGTVGDAASCCSSSLLVVVFALASATASSPSPRCSRWPSRCRSSASSRSR